MTRAARAAPESTKRARGRPAKPAAELARRSGGVRLTVLVDEADAELLQAVAASGRRSLTSYLRLVLAAHAEMVRGGPAAVGSPT